MGGFVEVLMAKIQDGSTRVDSIVVDMTSKLNGFNEAILRELGGAKSYGYVDMKRDDKTLIRAFIDSDPNPNSKVVTFRAPRGDFSLKGTIVFLKYWLGDEVRKREELGVDYPDITFSELMEIQSWVRT